MRLPNITGLRCVECNTVYPQPETPAEELYTCPACGIAGILDVEFDYDRIAHQGFGKSSLAAADPRTGPLTAQGIWRYLPLLPVDPQRELPTLAVGWTPVMALPHIAKRWGIANFFVKDDGRLPTGSFKDRASAIGATRAKQLGYPIITCASTGNAASSLAGFSANLGLTSYIFVPAHAPEGKVAQLRIFKSNVLLVEGSYDQAYYLCQDAAREFGWYNRNCAINPFLVEGKKTCGLEIGEQLAANMPDWVAVAVGDGCTIAGIWKGLKEMKRLGITDRLPRLLGVQAQGAAPIFDAFTAGDPPSNKNVRTRPATTMADSIAVGQPRNQAKALRAIAESGGTMVQVTDEEILSAMYELARTTGIFGEPAGVTGVAGLLRAITSRTIQSTDTVLHIISGNGLKDIRAAQRATPEARHIPVSLDAVRAIVAEQSLARAQS